MAATSLDHSWKLPVLTLSCQLLWRLAESRSPSTDSCSSDWCQSTLSGETHRIFRSPFGCRLHRHSCPPRGDASDDFVESDLVSLSGVNLYSFACFDWLVCVPERFQPSLVACLAHFHLCIGSRRVAGRPQSVP